MIDPRVGIALILLGIGFYRRRKAKRAQVLNICAICKRERVPFPAVAPPDQLVRIDDVGLVHPDCEVREIYDRIGT